MKNLEQVQARRVQFLHKLYEESGGTCTRAVSMYEVGSSLGFDRDETEEIVHYWSNENLIEQRYLEGGTLLKHEGLKLIERAFSAPKQATPSVPSAINILQIQSMVGSQIQQGTHESTQSLTFTQSQIDAVREFVSLLKEELPNSALTDEALDVASAETATLEAQLRSSQPKAGIVRESLKSLRTILEGAAGDVVASQLLLRLIQLL